MSKTFNSILVIVTCLIFVSMSNTFGQAGDTLVVSALDGEGNMNLVNTIRSDTTASGERVPNRVYVLQQTGPVDTVYFTNGSINVNYDLKIVGKRNPVTGYIPVIAPGFLPNGNTSGTFFRMNTGKGSVYLKNLYITRWNTEGQNPMAQTVWMRSDSIRIEADHCVFDAQGGRSVFGINSWYCSLFITNCVFRDNLGQWNAWVGQARDADTLSFVNNTFFGVQGAYPAADLGYVKYLRYEHNTSFAGTFIPLIFPQLTEAVIRNNIFYDNAAFGADSALIRGFFDNSANNSFGYSIFFLDSLSSLSLDPYNFTEADRNVVIENNAYFWSQKLRDYWQAVSDTSTVPGKITPPVFMDDKTIGMFNDDASWPGLSMANNTNTDPEFSSEMVEEAVDSLIKFVDLKWNEGSAGDFHGTIFSHGSPLNIYSLVPNNWAETQGHPVPENLRYSNVALQSAGTDGKALGDLNWFPEQITNIEQIDYLLPTQIKLTQNYPNPFNPSTTIEFEIPKSGLVSLFVYNILGQKVGTLIDGYKKAGSYKVEFDASKLASGIYFYKLLSNGSTISKKMIVMK